MQLRLCELHYNLGHVLHQQGNLAGAVASYRQTLAFNPGYVSAHHSLGVVLDEQGLRLAAIEHYRRRSPSAWLYQVIQQFRLYISKA
ncbi:MAG: tetratricopeptide repeat protein [Leptolyngbyaceae cyanobacterium CRU_2_3]|nr:tetratricopeptide repeat protein [Leptolyngbyaceae cyanobacterium CRU_2_3]